MHRQAGVAPHSRLTKVLRHAATLTWQLSRTCRGQTHLIHILLCKRILGGRRRYLYKRNLSHGSLTNTHTHHTDASRLGPGCELSRLPLQIRPQCGPLASLQGHSGRPSWHQQTLIPLPTSDADWREFEGSILRPNWARPNWARLIWTTSPYRLTSDLNSKTSQLLGRHSPGLLFRSEFSRFTKSLAHSSQLECFFQERM